MDKTPKKEQMEALAGQILQLSRDWIVVNLKFLDAALVKLRWKTAFGIDAMATDGQSLYYDPVFVLKKYKEEPNYITRVYLHLLLHCVFFHSFHYDKLQKEYWDMAADMALESMILDMGLDTAGLWRDEELLAMLSDYKKEVGKLTAERLYRFFLVNEPSNRRRKELQELFGRDAHLYWEGTEKEMSVSLADWKKISERIKADLKSFSKGKNNGEALMENLVEATREKYDYGAFLRRFMTMGEQIKVNEEEFDYIYYTYGLREYGNMPLVEPLEYADEKRIKEFVIAIDTSASCRGKTVQEFLKKTYSIMKGGENFFQKINVHIIQCDSAIQSDTRITSQEEFDLFLKNGKFAGFGATDFRPVFTYVEELIKGGEFENLKGLIYFTDGYGLYPEKMPEYDVAFVFLKEDAFMPKVPPWAMKLVLEREDIEKEEAYEYRTGKGIH